MFPHDQLLWLQDTAVATAIRESDLLFPVVETVHVLAIALVVGTIAQVDLRLLGFGFRGRTVAELTRAVLPWTLGSFLLASVTGALLFASNPVHYFANGPFRLKFLLLLLAGGNAALFHLLGRRPVAARLSRAVSLGCWVAIIATGRWIGFTLQ